jgi:adenylyltransferase/sulfurtransferase
MTPKDLSRELRQAMAAHAERAYPAECCGVITSDGEGALRYIEIPNIAGSAAASPTSSRSSRDGYVMDPKALMGAIESAEAAGGALVAVVHSHPDVGSYFSAEDKRAALGDGDEPLWPGIGYIVISCKSGITENADLYVWSGATRDFSGSSLPIER